MTPASHMHEKSGKHASIGQTASHIPPSTMTPHHTLTDTHTHANLCIPSPSHPLPSVQPAQPSYCLSESLSTHSMLFMLEGFMTKRPSGHQLL